jgi:hypothetical protein
VVLAHLLQHYDIKLPEGADKPKQQHFGLAIVPDEKATVLIKLRQ